ncbi:probable ATP-dependent RNA helicase DDX10 [Caerostris darwini]|uniref:ATP-dependent RNA helicase n=1 Tax=Caerostris darwini TaxID=1538125 RepID=A0AAV4VEC7_9ARAC|nr:probable ATP-dependent RNA helicase DDX10 [Caerostris darwini]
MGPYVKFNRRKIDKRFLSKNKNLKLYKEKHSKINLFKEEVSNIISKYEEFDSLKSERFQDFPLTERTKKGLRENNYNTPTEIQKEAIGFALKGHDILGAAKTGSGKTLAFIIPVLEKLYCLGWSILDGLGALIITPTRELAYQIFEVLRKVGARHSFSAALVIGGKDLAKEKKALEKCNILICTPGRLLQHMDENPNFDTLNLKILVLDEADRILDLGFQKAVNAILENLPPERQTLLFSATQTKSVKDLARLSLKNPVYVSVHEHAKHTTPEGLQQNYVVCEAHDKMNMIWSFIKTHKKQKILIFMSSCKQVKYMYESFCRLRPGVTVMALYGTLHQLRRMEIYDEFSKKIHAVMFATDIAARGLDFPNVNWVVQLDCPEDVNTYIHRAGRTARYEKGGEALLVLLPSEEKSMVEQLHSRKIPIEKIEVNPRKLMSIQKKLELICGRDVNLKDSCERAFKSYLKNLFLMKDKTIFDVTAVNAELYAQSLGMVRAPRVRFLEKHLKNQEKKMLNSTNSTNKVPLPALTKTIQKHKSACDVLSSDEESENIDWCKTKTAKFVFNDEELKEVNDGDFLPHSAKSSMAKKILNGRTMTNKVVKYDENGQPVREVCGQIIPVVGADIKKDLETEGYNIEKAILLLEEENKIDKTLFKDKMKTKHKEERLKKKKENLEKNARGASAVLDDDDEGDNQDNVSNRSNESENEIDPNNMNSGGEESEDEIDPNNLNASDVEESENENNRSTLNTSDSDNESENEIISNHESDSKNIDTLDMEESSEADENISDSENEEQVGKRKKKLNAFKKAKKRRIDVMKENQKTSKTDRFLEDDEQLALHFLSNN